MNPAPDTINKIYGNIIANFRISVSRIFMQQLPSETNPQSVFYYE
jgi:hypothetical protein